MRRVAAGIAMVLALAACGDADEPAVTVVVELPTTTTLGATTTSTTVPATTLTVPVTTVVTLPPTTVTVPPTTPEVDVPWPEAAPPVPLVVAAPSGVRVLGPDGSEQTVIEGAVDLAFDDTMGGVVFQRPFDPDEPPPIFWLPAGADLPELIAVPQPDGGWVQLEDVEVVEGSARVFYTDGRGFDAGPESAIIELQMHDLATGEVVTIGTAGGWEASATPISVGGGVVAYNNAAEGFAWFAFSDLRGNLIAVDANPLPDEVGCFDRNDCPVRSALSSSGAALAYVQPGAPGTPFPFELVVVDFESGAELGRADVRFEGEPLVDRIDLREGLAVVNRDDPDLFDVAEAALVVDLEAGTVIQLPRLGTATFLRAPINAGPLLLP